MCNNTGMLVSPSSHLHPSTLLVRWYSTNLCAPCKQEITYKHPCRLRCHIAREMLIYCQHPLVAFIRDYHLDDRAQTTQRISALQQAHRGCKSFLENRVIRFAHQAKAVRWQSTDDTGLDRFTQRTDYISLSCLGTGGNSWAKHILHFISL